MAARQSTALLLLSLAFAPACVSDGALVALRLSPAAPSVPLNSALTLRAEAEFESGRVRAFDSDLSWSSSNPEIAEVSSAPDSAGRVTARSKGVTLITAESPEEGLVADSAPAFAQLLRRLARLDDMVCSTTAELANYACGRPKLDARVVGDVMALARNASASGVDAVKLYPEYLAAVEALWRFVDTWRATAGQR